MVTGACCATAAPPCRSWTTAPSARASGAGRRSPRSGSRRCRSRVTASTVSGRSSKRSAWPRARRAWPRPASRERTRPHRDSALLARHALLGRLRPQASLRLAPGVRARRGRHRDGGAARPRRRGPPGGTVPRSGDALPADPPGPAEPPGCVTWPARPRRRGRAVGGGARAPAAHPRRCGARATGGRDRVVGDHLLRARAGGASPVEHGRGARAPEERAPHGPHVPSRSARPRRRLRGDRRSPRGGACLGARRGGAAGASALGTARAWLSRGGAAQADDRALPAGPGACARRARARPGPRPRLLRARDAGRGGRPVREGRGAGAGPPRRARGSRRRVRAARRDACGLRRVPARAPARSRVRVAAPVRRVRGRQCPVAGPVSRLPPLEHPPSRPRLTPLSLAVFPRLAIAAFDLVFPALCPVCGNELGPRRRDPLCGPCWDAIDRIAPPFCDRCGAPMPMREPPESRELGACRSHRGSSAGVARATLPGRGSEGAVQAPSDDPEEGPPPPAVCSTCAANGPAYDYARSAAVYGGVTREALHRLKFGGRRALARPLADLTVEQCGATLRGGIAAVVPVPLARDREWERGFNQAALLAERIARRLEVPVRAAWLARERATKPQSDLHAAERLANVRGAFRAAPAVADRHVLLVDDVLTTGATLAQFARALPPAGPARICV